MNIQTIISNNKRSQNILEQKDQFNKFRRIFHPDKLTNDNYKEISQQIFNNIIYSYKIHENSLQRYLLLNYGKLGIQMYQNFNEFFMIIEKEIQQGKFNQDYIYQKYSKEIQSIIDFVYYNDQIVRSMLFSTEIVYQLQNFNDLTVNNIQTTFGFPINQQLFGLQLYPSVFLSGNLQEGFQSGINLQVQKQMTIKDLKINTFMMFNNQDIYQPNLRAVFEYKDFDFNVNHKIGSNNYDAVLAYHLNENQALKFGCEYQEGTPNFFLQFINAIPLQNGYSFYNDNTISAHIIRNSFKLKKEINQNFSLKTKLKVVTSFHHYQNQYYKIGQLFLGYKYKINAYEFSSGINFQHIGIQYFSFTFKLYNFKLKIPLFITDDMRILALGLCLTLASGIFFGVKSIIDSSQQKKRQLMLKHNIFSTIQNDIDKWKSQFLIENSIIQQAFFIPKINKNNKLKDVNINVTKIVQQLYLIEGKINFNKLKSILDDICQERSQNIFQEYQFILVIHYEINNKQKKRKILKDETTYLNQIWFLNSQYLLMKILKQLTINKNFLLIIKYSLQLKIHQISLYFIYQYY